MHTIIGTAGHIDHGKTALIRALTGRDTDTLPEEKAREITIDIGFAYWKEGLTVIDVPGHERFVKNMVAGVSAIDLALFVVAADDGPMPQSREHLDILDLLGIRRGVVALTKTDLVDSEWLELVTEEVQKLTRGSFLENAPIHAVSSATGEGIPDLERGIMEAVELPVPKPDRGIFRLPIDRSFSIRGFGTVVTGTVISGRVHPEDDVELHPAGRRLRVRGVQHHEQDVEAASIGDRAALNLADVEKEEVTRGDILGELGWFTPTVRFDARLRLLSSCPAPLKNRTRIRLHVGTAEVMARIVFLDHETVHPGESVLGQLRLEAPAVVSPGDRLVFRRYSPAITLGGGVVLDAHPPRHKTGDATARLALQGMESDDFEEVLKARLTLSRTDARSAQMLAVEVGSEKSQIVDALDRLVESQKAVRLDHGDGWFLSSENWEKVLLGITDALSKFHQNKPLKGGLNRDELRQAVPENLDHDLFEIALRGLIRDGKLKATGPILSLSAHRISLSPAQEVIRSAVGNLLAAGLATPPVLDEILRNLSEKPGAVHDVIEAMQDLGEVVRADSDILFHCSVIDDLRDRLVAYLRENGEITVANFRTLAKTTRKYALPLINLFDNEGLTIRKGDVRILAK